MQDAGLYRITAENELGRIQATARLEILGRSASRSTGYVRSGSASSFGKGHYYSSGVSTSPYHRSAASSARDLISPSSSSYSRGSSTPR